MPEMLSLNIDFQVLAAAVEYVCQSQKEEGPVEYFRKTSDFSTVRFATKSLRKLFGAVKTEDSVWKTRDAILYEIVFKQDFVEISCCCRDKGLSSAYKAILNVLVQAFAPNQQQNSNGKIVLQKWILCQNAMNQIDVRKAIQSYLAKELLEWENGVFTRLGHKPPYEHLDPPPESPDYPVPGESDGVEDGKVFDIHCQGYERNRRKRRECLDYYGAVCQICGFDFGKVYGAEFAGIIEVHHIDPLCRTGEHEINSVKDLIPVCSNCHTALHAKKGRDEVYKPKELINKMKQSHS